MKTVELELNGADRALVYNFLKVPQIRRLITDALVEEYTLRGFLHELINLSTEHRELTDVVTGTQLKPKEEDDVHKQRI